MPHHVNRRARQVRRVLICACQTCCKQAKLHRAVWHTSNRPVYQTCQADVKTCQGDGKAETDWSSLTHVKQAAWRPQTGQRRTSNPIREDESKRRHLLHRKLHGHAHESNRLKISEAPAEWMRVADYPWQSWNWMAYAMYIKHARPTSKHARFDGKAETEWSEPSMSIYLSLYLSIYLFIYLCNIYVTIYLSILCTSNMLQTGQATPSSLTHVKQAGISNMPGRRQNMPGRRQSWNWMEWTKYVNLSISLSIYLSIYLSM